MKIRSADGCPSPGAPADEQDPANRHPLVEFYRCPASLTQEMPTGTAPSRPDLETSATYDVLPSALAESLARLPLSERLNELRLERYRADIPMERKLLASEAIRRLYYKVRPLMPAAVRHVLQRIYMRDWQRLPFPSWPVDTSVENELERHFAQLIRAQGAVKAPFIWFWPDGAPSAITITHDVETSKGLAFIDRLMNVDDEFGFKAAYQLVPEQRYTVTPDLLQRIRSRQCEANVHGLNHNENLFADRSTFVRSKGPINRYIAEFGSTGFRSPCMYRKAEWLEELDIQYDMSVPNVAHLEPQRGGCCTVFPYFVGRVLEIPLTAAQDYSLFHILRDYSIHLWTRQIDLILQKHGLISFIIHPDYVIEPKAMMVYKDLLEHLRALSKRANLWCALPGEINAWWRQRSRMRLLQDGGNWKIEGLGSERARVAFACLQNEGLKFELPCPYRGSDE